MAINVYWCRSNTSIEELITTGAGTDSYISPLRIAAPEPLLKHIDYKEFFGPAVSKCPAIVDDLKNIFVIKSPVSIKIEVGNTRMNVTGQTVDFAKSFLGNPQGKFGIHQLGLGYLFFSDKSLMATQLPAYYDQNSFTEGTFSISASFDIGRWFRPAAKPAFIIKPGVKEIDIKEGDALIYFKLNTTEKVNLIEFDDPKFNLNNEENPAMLCAILKKQSQGIIPLAKCYEYFDQFKMKQRILKLIKSSKIEKGN
jgi:hypothetical protein